MPPYQTENRHPNNHQTNIYLKTAYEIVAAISFVHAKEKKVFLVGNRSDLGSQRICAGRGDKGDGLIRCELRYQHFLRYFD